MFLKHIIDKYLFLMIITHFLKFQKGKCQGSFKENIIHKVDVINFIWEQNDIISLNEQLYESGSYIQVQIKQKTPTPSKEKQRTTNIAVVMHYFVRLYHTQTLKYFLLLY